MDIGVAMLGQGFMGRAHALAIGRVATFEGLALRPRLVAAAGRDAARLQTFAERFGVERDVAATGVVALCAFNYRFVPAVRLARQILEAGDLGELFHARFAYLQAWGADADTSVWRFDAG